MTLSLKRDSRLERNASLFAYTLHGGVVALSRGNSQPSTSRCVRRGHSRKAKVTNLAVTERGAGLADEAPHDLETANFLAFGRGLFNPFAGRVATNLPPSQLTRPAKRLCEHTPVKSHTRAGTLYQCSRCGVQL